MEKMKKGDQAKYTGYLLTVDEYNYYKGLEKRVNKVLKAYDEIQRTI